MASIAIVGCGTMGEAILAGLMAAEGAPSVQVVTTRRAERAAWLVEQYGVTALVENASAVEWADVVLLCVKPQMAQSVVLEPAFARGIQGKLLISICAGLSTQRLAAWAPETAILRAMPNTPCLIHEGMTVLSAGPHVADVHLEVAAQIFGAVGRVAVLEEKHMDAVTGLSGSGPAFACVVLESLADGGVRMGLPRDVAVELAAQTMQGAARMVLMTGKHPAALKDEVTTPAGCTIAGLLTMEDGRIRSTLARTIEEATKVASTLGRPNGER